MLRGAINAHLVGAQRPRVLLTTLPEEEHGLGLLMAEALLASEGAQCLSLGTRTPLPDIRLAAMASAADIVALSFGAAYPARQAVERPPRAAPGAAGFRRRSGGRRGPARQGAAARRHPRHRRYRRYAGSTAGVARQPAARSFLTRPGAARIAACGSERRRACRRQRRARPALRMECRTPRRGHFKRRTGT
ncbi:MAG: hypothetical protein MZW92_13505 [Comamonadaceae bacterium]|nr:hypothetical protein [Comamonadaceae bacterium]